MASPSSPRLGSARALQLVVAPAKKKPLPASSESCARSSRGPAALLCAPAAPRGPSSGLRKAPEKQAVLAAPGSGGSGCIPASC